MDFLRSRLAFASLMAGITAGLFVGTGAGYSAALFTSTRTVGSNTFTTATSWDTVAPTVSASVIAKSGQYFAGYVRQGGSYYVYANATDTGSPASGIATIKANVSAITAGATAVSLASGSFTVEGVTYGFRSAQQTADNPLAAGAVSYSLTSTDNAGNSRTQSFSGTVDNTAPTASDIQCVDGGGTVGTVEAGDVCTYTFSEIIDPESIQSGWTGAATSVVMRWVNNAANDSFTIWNATNTTQLNLGSVNTHGDYTTANMTVGATGTPCTMTLNTSNNTITIVLGTPSGSTRNDGKKNTFAWTPSTAAFDRAGNAMSGTAVNESGVADRDF